MFIVQVEITVFVVQWKVLGSLVYQEGFRVIELVIINIEYEHLFTNEVHTLK
jgi:hypothetical protein